MKKKFWKWLFRLAFRLRLYFIWSRIYRLLFEWRYRNKGAYIPIVAKLSDIEDAVSKMQWRPDPWFALWDAVSYPQTAWVKLAEGKPAGDCDDISLAIAAAMRRWYAAEGRDAIVDGRASKFELPYMLSVVWLEDGKWFPVGHNVCVFAYCSLPDQKNKWAYWSNWFSGKIQWDFDSVFDIIFCVNKNAIAAAAWTIDLKLLDIFIMKEAQCSSPMYTKL